MKLRAVAATAAVALAGTFGGAGLLAIDSASAGAQPQAHGVQGTASIASDQFPCVYNGTPYTCTATVTHLGVVDGVLTAFGTVSDTGNTFTSGFSAPVQLGDAPVTSAAAPLQATGSCQILDLTLGPLHLDLLGLVVDLNQIHLNITAQQGPGNLLGNLLCAVAHLLDNTQTNALQQIVNLLNQILGAL